MNATAKTFSGFDAFCGQTFWTLGDTLSRGNPRFDDCFLHTILVWIPVGILWLWTPLFLFRANQSKFKPLPWTALLFTKLVISLLLASDALLLLIKSIFEWKNSENFYLVWFVYPSLLFISMLNTTALVLICQRRGVITSGVLSLTWLTFCICGAPEFYAQIFDRTQGAKNTDDLRFVCYMVWYPLICVQTILHAFADKFGDDHIEGPNQSTELLVSFFNRLAYAWVTPLILTGHRKALEKSDLNALNRRDTSRSVVEEWNKFWPQPTNFNRAETPAQITKNSALAKRLSSSRSSRVPEPSRASEKTPLLAEHKESLCKADDLPATKGSYTYSRLFNKSATTHAAPKVQYPSLAWNLIRCHAGLLAAIALLETLSVLCQFVEPQLLNVILDYVQRPGSPLWVGILYSLGLFGNKLMQVFTVHQLDYMFFRTALKTKSMLTSSIFSKTLRLSNAARKKKTVGEIVNLVSIDVQKFYDICAYASLFVSIPLQLILCCYFLFAQLGFAVVTGLVILVLTMPFNLLLSFKMQKVQVQQMKLKDERLKMINEILSGIKVLKLYAWEKSMEKLVSEIRAKELKLIQRFYILTTLGSAMWFSTPFLVSIGTFGTFVLVDPIKNILTPQIAFVSLSLFNILRFPLNVMPSLVANTVQVYVSNKRLHAFLSADELDPASVHRQCYDGNAVLIRDGSFVWDPTDRKPTLGSVDLEIAKGQLVAIVGKVGAGKSSLLSALLGELTKIGGYVAVQGSVAYVPQLAWIQNLSLRQNIVFDREFDQDKYDRVVDACALRADFASLPAGDSTEIGEKGINLSGGQKARVSLARAVYQDSDLYLLDDPLSAVDSHVGKHIFEQVLSGETGLLKDKTRILVTHGLRYLKLVDDILVLNEGKVSEQGKYEQLMRNGGAFAEVLEEYLMMQADDEAVEETLIAETEERQEVLAELEKFDPGLKSKLERQLSRLTSSTKSGSTQAASRTRRVSEVESHTVRQTSTVIRPASFLRQASVLESKQKPTSDKLIEEETAFTGRVPFSIYLAYLRSLTWIVAFGYLIAYALSAVSAVASNFWLAAWTDGSSATVTEKMPLGHRLLGYGILGIGQAIFVCISGLFWAFGAVRASKILHDKLVQNLLRSPMSFFDTTPLGRILNRVGKDMDVLDEQLPLAFRTWTICIFQIFSTLIVIIISTPLFTIVIIPMAVIYVFVLKFYVSTSRQLRRLESASRSPVYSHLQETINGAASIRAYDVAERFVIESERRVDANIATMFPSIIANGWLGVRLESMAAVMIFFASLFAILMGEGGSVTAGIAGLSITYALDISAHLNYAVRETSDLETHIVAMERVQEYSNTPQEVCRRYCLQAAELLTSLIQAAWESEDSQTPPEDWPDKGAVEFSNYATRYRQGLELVLKGITAKILPREKIGVVGRTGAGKSSLSLSLFRLIEAAGGEILIDGRNISKMGLHDLRSKLTIIPQDPVLFSGTLRLNLDPFEKRTDDELWTALGRAHLREFVQSLPDRLQHHCSEGGENLSVGQRQLLCLARALLRKSRILVLDEATAAVDLQTDALVQNTIRNEFHRCTIITIAHRLSTILDNDRVMVLDDGSIIEFASPQHLLEDKQSVFFAMARDEGIVQLG